MKKNIYSIRYYLLKLFMLFCFGINNLNSYGQLIVDNSFTAVDLVQNVLLGSGVTASNIQFTGHIITIGSFNGAASNLGMTEGVILSTGKISDAIGPNNDSGIGDELFQPGDMILTSIAGMTTHDAAILEFDFVPLSDTIRFNYIFGSEEYLEYVNAGFNDVFAFLLSGPNPLGGTYTNHNIAIIPGTTIPVSIDNVNSFVNSAYYNDNGDGLSMPQLSDPTVIQYDGFTTTLQAVAAVIPGNTYHIKLAIADAGDGVFDSGVFLEANSFSSPVTSVNVGDTLAVEGCKNGEFLFSRTGDISTQLTYCNKIPLDF